MLTSAGMPGRRPTRRNERQRRHASRRRQRRRQRRPASARSGGRSSGCCEKWWAGSRRLLGRPRRRPPGLQLHSAPSGLRSLLGTWLQGQTFALALAERRGLHFSIVIYEMNGVLGQTDASIRFFNTVQSSCMLLARLLLPPCAVLCLSNSLACGALRFSPCTLKPSFSARG